jgi:hypothetical protein
MNEEAVIKALNDLAESETHSESPAPLPPTAQGKGTSTESAKKPISDAKLVANRANGARSPGPKTEEGKAKSKFNAVKHGFTASLFPEFISKEGEDGEKFTAPRASLFEHYQPIGPIEKLFAEKVAVEFIRYARLVCREQRPRLLGEWAYFDYMNKTTRYQSSINRQLFQAVAELERQQAKRKSQQGQEGGTDEEMEAEELSAEGELRNEPN